MKSFILLTCLLFSFSGYADDKKPEAKLKLSEHNCVSPCKITLDGSKSEASKGKTITKYIFGLGNGDTIESVTPMIEFTYFNFVEENDSKKKDRYKKWKKYIDWSHHKFKKLEKFETTLKIVQSDYQTSKEDKQQLTVKGSDVLPTVDGDDVIPPKPDQALSDSTLLGIDVDGDNARDDVEIFINNNITNINQRRGLKQNARAWQEGLSVVDDKPASIQASIKSLEASGCLIAIMADDLLASSKLRKKIEAEFYNTKDRLIAEDKKSRNFNGASMSTYDPFAKEDLLKCEFTIE